MYVHLSGPPVAATHSKGSFREEGSFLGQATAQVGPASSSSASTKQNDRKGLGVLQSLIVILIGLSSLGPPEGRDFHL
jgi:hypothetical protein